MLSSIHIRNLAVVEAVDLEFAGGFSVMTGETGAGKSILVDALALALGARAEGRLVRAGAERTDISAVFDHDALPAGALDWLKAQELDTEEDCVVRRTLSPEGRSRGFINGQPVTMQSLRELGEQLVDICGQQAYLGLRHAGAQRELLDQFGNHTTALKRYADCHQAWQQSQAELDAHEQSSRDWEQRAELLGFQCQELTGLGLVPGEYATLQQEHRRLAASQKIESGLSAAVNELYEAESGAAQDTLARCVQQLDELADDEPGLDATAGLLREAGVLVNEAAGDLRDRLNRLEHDPAREAQVAQRLADARDLARKHRVEPDDLPALEEKLAAELEQMSRGESHREELAAALEKNTAALAAAAAKLSAARRKAGKALGKQVSDYMQELGMPGGLFSVELKALDAAEPRRHGAESIEFMVRINPGQPAGPLGRVASGGELSRVSLALQVAAIGPSRAGTLVFDEVDTGVGGRVAEMVGQQLRRLGAQSQVLCVTHLPQVASQANQHYQVVKHTSGKATATEVLPLGESERVEELARMLGGLKITKRTREHAREMLADA